MPADRLTRQESHVLAACALGLTSKEIASRFGISRHTVDEHISNAMRKLDAHNRVEAVTVALARGLVDANATSGRPP